MQYPIPTRAGFVMNEVHQNRRVESFFGKGRGENYFCKKWFPLKTISNSKNPTEEFFTFGD